MKECVNDLMMQRRELLYAIAEMVVDNGLDVPLFDDNELNDLLADDIKIAKLARLEPF